MNVKDIVKQYLEQNGYDVLRNDINECSCDLHALSDLLPCGGPFDDCEPDKKSKVCEETAQADGNEFRNRFEIIGAEGDS